MLHAVRAVRASKVSLRRIRHSMAEEQIRHYGAARKVNHANRTPAPIGGYRTPAQRVTVIAVTGQSVMPRLRRSR